MIDLCKVVLSVMVVTLLGLGVAFAQPGESFSGFTCTSFDGSVSIQGSLQTCEDSRYNKWNQNGCYLVEVLEGSNKVLEIEMIRDFMYRESQQGFYSLYAYDKSEWVLNGMIIKLQSDVRQREYRFDVRGNSREQMTVFSRGYCVFS